MLFDWRSLPRDLFHRTESLIQEMGRKSARKREEDRPAARWNARNVEMFGGTGRLRRGHQRGQLPEQQAAHQRQDHHFQLDRPVQKATSKVEPSPATISSIASLQWNACQKWNENSFLSRDRVVSANYAGSNRCCESNCRGLSAATVVGSDLYSARLTCWPPRISWVDHIHPNQINGRVILLPGDIRVCSVRLSGGAEGETSCFGGAWVEAAAGFWFHIYWSALRLCYRRLEIELREIVRQHEIRPRDQDEDEDGIGLSWTNRRPKERNRPKAKETTSRYRW